MKLKLIGTAGVAALTLALAGVASAAELKGTITSHKGDTVMVRAAEGEVAVHITPSTKIRATTGALNARSSEAPSSDLIRGLAVYMVTAQEGDKTVATEVSFKGSDLRVAKQIAAGLHETEGQVAQNKAGIEEAHERLENVGELVAAGRTKVFFDVGKTTISAKGQQDLKDFAEKAKATKGYRIAIVGRADPTGDAAANQRLSERRAAAVKAYLINNTGVLPGRIVPNTALGENSPAQDPDPPKNNAEGRRVTVTIMVSGATKPSGSR